MATHDVIETLVARYGHRLDGLHIEIDAHAAAAKNRGLSDREAADEIGANLEQSFRSLRARDAHQLRKGFEAEHGAEMIAGTVRSSELRKRWVELHDSEIAAAQEAAPPPSAQSVSDADRAAAREELDKLRGDPAAMRELLAQGSRAANEVLSPLIDTANGIAR